MSSIFSKKKIAARILLIPTLFAVGACVMLTVSWTAHQKSTSAGTAINLAGRQRMLNQRHAKEISLAATGVACNFEGTRKKLIESATLLLNGGESDFGPVGRTSDADTVELLKSQMAALKTTFEKGDVLLAAPKSEDAKQALLDQYEAIYLKMLIEQYDGNISRSAKAAWTQQ